MNWKCLLTTISLSSLILTGCGTNDDTAMNDTARTQDTANLRTVSNRTDGYRNTWDDDIAGNDNRGIITNVSDNNAYWNGRFNDRLVDNYDIENWVSRDISDQDNTNRDDVYSDRSVNNPASNVQNRTRNVSDRAADDQNRRMTTRNVNNNQNRDITARNIANNTADNDINGNNRNNRNRMEVADRAADKIAQMREVDRANVILTDNNAYVAVKLTDNANKKLTADVEKKISDVVKATNRNVDHVYVSVNPDFYKRTTSYAEDIRNGRPVQGFFDEFGELVRRVFPTER